MNLPDELLRVRRYLNGANPPANETLTCNRVIRPLLQAGGYEHEDIDEQGHDAAGGIPDYTLLPGMPQAWFLEAKAWSVTLTDTHVTQACDYPNRQGKRWVVLTNGREWRLYDNFIVGVPPAERRVVTAQLNCEGQVEALLGALSKASALAGELENYVRQARITDYLRRQMTEPASDVIQAITFVVREKLSLSSVTPAEILAHFQSSPAAAPAVGIREASPPPVPLRSDDTAPVSPSDTNSNSLTLRELRAMGNTLQGKNPASLTLPDGRLYQTSSWRAVATGIVEWLLARHNPPALPFRVPPHSKLSFFERRAFPCQWATNEKTKSGGQRQNFLYGRKS